MKKIIRYLLKPTASDNEDNQRQEFVLNVLILGSTLFAFLALLSATIAKIQLVPNHEAIPILLLISITLFFSILFFLTKVGYYKVAASLFLTLYFSTATFALFTWGFFLPQALLIYMLLIVITGILISSRAAFITTIFLSFTLLVLSYIQLHKIYEPDIRWLHSSLSGASSLDAYVYSATFMIVALITWLSNRELEKSLTRARASEAALIQEKELLELKVRERTQALKVAQEEKVLQLHRLAELGQVTSDLFHDIVNPLTGIMLNLEIMNKQQRSNLAQQALMGTKRIEEFISAARKQIQTQQEITNFSINTAVKQVVQLLASKARQEDVTIEILINKDITIKGDCILFYRCITNLISNAIDSYTRVEKAKRKVVIKLGTNHSMINLQVADNGCGIHKKDQPYIFEPLFTTKSSDKGTGIGLSIVKQIIEKDFNGEVSFTSTANKGSTFTLSIPKKYQVSS